MLEGLEDQILQMLNSVSTGWDLQMNSFEDQI